MRFKLPELLTDTARDLDIPFQLVEIFISGDLGSRWIIDKKLNTSEVELGMFIKTIRKRLAYEFNNNGSLALMKGMGNKDASLKRLKGKYDTFYDLHRNYYLDSKDIGSIIELLQKDRLIFESGISKERFFSLLPILLSKINPAELELSYLINTVLRHKIALLIEKEINVKLYVRGSLMFFNSHSFGNGYLANFCHERNTYANYGTYFPLQGSDLDVKCSEGLSSKKITPVVEKFRRLVNDQFSNYNNYLTIELDSISSNTLDSIWEVGDLESLQKIFISSRIFSELESYSEMYSDGKYQNTYVPLLKREIVDREKKKYRNKVILGDGGLLILVRAFELTLDHFRVNKNLSEEFSKRWSNVLYPALMETDFYGIIDIKKIFLAFQSIFLFSGYRFSRKEEKLIFNKILEFYFKLNKSKPSLEK